VPHLRVCDQNEPELDDVAAKPAAASDDVAHTADLQQRLQDKERELRELTATCRRDVAQAIEQAKARLERDADNQLQIDRARMVEGLLPVFDNLTLAREAATRQRADPALVDGITLVESQFLEKLEALGAKRFASVGTRFDPKLHQAVGTVPAPNRGLEGVVLTELQPGFCLGDRLIRPAMVLVGRE